VSPDPQRCASGADLELSNVTNFADLGLAEVVLRAFREEGYTSPTPIQERSIPSLLEGRDLLGLAQTGTGKTAAFAAPIITRLLEENRRPAPKTARALVLAPTRELAAQIADSFKTYARFARLHVACVFGGVGFGPQVHAMARGLDVLVATPGRLIDHLEQRTVDLSQTHVVVLDEADHMLDLGFVKPIRHILSRLPKERQNLFFSATMPKEIAGLAAEMLRDPVRVEVAPPARTADRVAQRVIRVQASAKRDLLARMLSEPKYERSIVFTRTKRGADRVAEHLWAVGVEAAAIHGNKSQGARQRALDGFKKGGVRVLVATDIAARGIDVDAVSHVFNYELPEVAEAYVHRIGRTARAGLEGEAISFCADDERDLLRQIERVTRQIIPTEDLRGTVIPPMPRIAQAPPPVEDRPAQQPRGRNARPQQRQGQPGGGRPQQRGGAPRPQNGPGGEARRGPAPSRGRGPRRQSEDRA
jgi:ATP-dependent RNA helicase RhlE